MKLYLILVYARWKKIRKGKRERFIGYIELKKIDKYELWKI